MPSLPKYPRRPLLLDLDGVLWFSTEAHRLAFQEALKECGYPWKISKTFFMRLAGYTTEKAFEELFVIKKRKLSSAELARLSLKKRLSARHYLWTRAKLAPGIRHVLKRLRKFFRLGLVSSSHPQTVNLFLKRSGSRTLFDLVLSSGDVPVSKPSPKIYQAALRIFRAKPLEAMAVEDTPMGVRAAHRARIPVLGMRGTCAPRALRKAGAFGIISRLAEVLNYAAHF